jgi:3-dehydroquinate dehydratase/shikimate dehydrogenase
MKLVVTIYEKTPEAAIGAIRALTADHDMIEVRLDACGADADFRQLRAATAKPIILTNRGGNPVDIDAAIRSGIDFVDVELGQEIRNPDRTVLSHHDFDGIPKLEPLFEKMLDCRCAHIKIAVTPRNLRENEMLLDALRRHHHGLSLIGMGERGLYSRILAPFFGSELFFASRDETHNAAPGQLALDRALPIYGDRRLLPPHKIFAIAGNPAGKSLSPTIHNPLFREHGLPGAYTIASFETFEEIADSFEQGRIAGLSVTAPFKQDALQFAEGAGATVGPNAREANAVNTLVHTDRGVIADNTDVDGFEALLRAVRGKRAAVVGAGATSRAALVALRRAGIDATVYNRTPRPGSKPLEALARSKAEIIINTLPTNVEIKIPPTDTYIDVAYHGPRATGHGQDLLEAQAIRQNELFRDAFR